MHDPASAHSFPSATRTGSRLRRHKGSEAVFALDECPRCLWPSASRVHVPGMDLWEALLGWSLVSVLGSDLGVRLWRARWRAPQRIYAALLAEESETD